ncbi:MAG: histidine kinase [Ekhidna sp.]
MAVHGLVLFLYYDFSPLIASLDSLVYNLIFGTIVPGFWFIVSFGGLNKDRISLLVTHLGAAGITIILWLGVSNFIMRLIFSDNANYLNFLSGATVWRIIIGALFYSISILIFYLIKYYQDMQKRMNRELELQALLKDSELRMLKSQINPHFIFNSLNSISALTVSMPEKAREMVIKLSDFLRYSLGKDNEELTSLADEIDNVTLYLEIEKVRFGDKLSFEMDIDSECQSIKVPNLILQPLLENAIKYGVYDNLSTVTIHLLCKLDHRHMIIRLSNSYDPKSSAFKGEGIGLKNVKKRLSLVYGWQDLMLVEQGEDQFTVQIKIPLDDED